ncbi:hypothetical protein BDQ17DRAFT_1366508, partial [Cyathus striatus]
MDRDHKWRSSYLSLPVREDDNPRGKVQIATKSSSPSNWIFPASWLFFAVLESQYLLFAAFASGGLPLHVSQDHQLELKGFFVIITILWQRVATFPMRGLVARIFSAEWHYQFDRSGNILHRETDKVSTLNSNIMDYTTHFFSRKASGTFRVAVVLSLVLHLLTGIAPAAIGVAVTSVEADTYLGIANLTIGSNETDPYYSNIIPLVTSRAAAITRFEQLDRESFKYTAQKNYVIPTPNIVQTSGSEDTSILQFITYQTDIAQFNFSCNWTLPEKYTNGSVLIVGMNWTMYQFPEAEAFLNPDNPMRFTSGIFPLIPTSNKSSSFIPVNETGMSVYLFAGGNSTYSTTATTAKNNLDINLDGIPTFTNMSNVFSMNGIFNSSLFSFLICDPRSNISSKMVSYFPKYHSLDIFEDSTLVGNMPQDVSNIIFSTSMLDAVAVMDEADGISASNMFLTRTANALFMSQSTFNVIPGNSSVQPFSLDRMNKNMNTYFLSASKAFTDGYRFNRNMDDVNKPIIQIPRYSTLLVHAKQQVESALTLAGSRYLFFATVVLTLLVTILTPLLYRGWKREKEYPFTIDSLSKARL